MRRRGDDEGTVGKTEGDTDKQRTPETQEVFDWEPRSTLDRLVYRGYPSVRATLRLGVVLIAAWLLVVHLAPGEFVPVTEPLVAFFVALSVLPALALVGYIWYSDITGTGPAWLLAITFVLSVLFANFAAVINNVVGNTFVLVLIERGVSRQVATVMLFFAVVAPAEEIVKLLAVRFQAYRTAHFDSVISGAVYGAVAGLGFATIENAFYISQVLMETSAFADTLADGSAIATVRALAGPGHVIWSAIAGYYLGLARFNRHYAGPIVLKGLLLAVVFHAVYNVLVTEVISVVTAVTTISPVALFFSFAIGYNGILFAFLLYKLSRYRTVHRVTYDESSVESELTEFDP